MAAGRNSLIWGIGNEILLVQMESIRQSSTQVLKTLEPNQLKNFSNTVSINFVIIITVFLFR